MARFILIPLLVLACGLGACSDAPSLDEARPAGESAASVSSPPAEPEDVRPDVGLDQILAVRGDDGPFLESLPPPRTVRAEAEENRHVMGQIDTVRTYVYDGLTIEAYEVTGGRTLVRHVEVTSAAYETAEGLSVGDTRSDVEAVLGPPVRDEGGTVAYETGEDPTPTTVEVRYRSGEGGVQRVASIEWSPYLD